METFDDVFEDSEKNVNADFTVRDFGRHAGLMEEW